MPDPTVSVCANALVWLPPLFYLCFFLSFGLRLFSHAPSLSPCSHTFSLPFPRRDGRLQMADPITLHSRCTVLVAVFPRFVRFPSPHPAAAFLTVVTLPLPVFPCCRLPPCMRLNLVLPPFDVHRFLSLLVPLWPFASDMFLSFPFHANSACFSPFRYISFCGSFPHYPRTRQHWS